MFTEKFIQRKLLVSVALNTESWATLRVLSMAQLLNHYLGTGALPADVRARLPHSFVSLPR